MVKSAKSRHKNNVISMWSLLCLLLALVVSPFVFPMYTLGLWEFIKSSDSSKIMLQTSKDLEKKKKEKGKLLIIYIVLHVHDVSCGDR